MVYNLERTIARLESEKEASEQQLNEQLMAVFRELKDYEEQNVKKHLEQFEQVRHDARIA